MEAHLTMAMNWQSYLVANDSLIQEQHELLRARVNSIMESLLLSETTIVGSEQTADPLSTHQCEVIA